MGTPTKYLPQPFEDGKLHSFLASILPGKALSVKHLPGSGAYHLIYVLTYPREAVESGFPTARERLSSDGDGIQLILRISGDHFTSIKTINEAATISWVQVNTSIPVPVLLTYSSTKDNVLGQEYMLFARSSGENAGEIFDSFSEQQRGFILDQLIDILTELHRHPMSHVGGLKFAGGVAVPGPLVEEHFWYEPEIKEVWPASESSSTLNMLGPYESYAAFIADSVKKYIHAIRIHSSLAFMRDTTGVLDQFLAFVSTKSELLSKTMYRLAHKDLHFGNLLVDSATARVTCVLDWEFAGVVPYPRWDPHKAFLWDTKPGQEALLAKRKFFGQFETRCRERGVEYLMEDAAFQSEEQEIMHRVQNLLRCIVEVCPRDGDIEAAQTWKGSMLAALAELGIDG